MRKSLFAAIGAVALSMLAGTLTAVPAQAAPGARPLTVMTFNIHHAAGTDEVLSLPRIADVIKANRADVVGLQEVDRHYSERSDWADQPAELAKLLGYHVVFGANIDEAPPAEGKPRIQYGTAILSRYPITAWQNTHLFRSPDQEQRGLLQATIDVRGKTFHFYDTHLAASSQTDRLQQAQQIVELVDHDQPGILVGDLNAEPTAPEIKTLAADLDDTWSAAGRGDSSSYPSEAPAKRIDMIFSTGRVQAIRSSVAHTDPVASDHLPVVAKIIIR
ncbi:metal-dependent hydrolase [Microlunatus elymi]|uniref:Metal-dependent hydrolase n=1 Tax=Microlunatus elymi TaxID=2596828 RepID=A0A516PY30_9ACTN|nr:endonuclease/exonuclease/phosphatase family protein [Microlunatus elymi]QDP96085.1 metal-dependent hydrolase [Microlunatus elymi]